MNKPYNFVTYTHITHINSQMQVFWLVDSFPPCGDSGTQALHPCSFATTQGYKVLCVQTVNTAQLLPSNTTQDLPCHWKKVMIAKQARHCRPRCNPTIMEGRCAFCCYLYLAWKWMFEGIVRGQCGQEDMRCIKQNRDIISLVFLRVQSGLAWGTSSTPRQEQGSY